MKRILLIVLCTIISFNAFGQAKKPTIMVVPSDAWCNTNGYVNTVDNMGTEQIVPDYVAALQNDIELLQVIGTINNLMAERNFPLQDLESVIKDIQTTNAEMMMLESKNGGTVAESMYDQVRNRAKADIIIQLTWEVEKIGPKKLIHYNLQGFDSYTNKQIAGSSGVGEDSHSVSTSVLIQEAVHSHMDPFCARLQAHFDDLFNNGREVTFLLRVFDTSAYDFESDFDGYELCEIIDDWFYDNTKNHRYTIADQSATQMNINQVRIELYDDRGRAQDANRFIRNLVRYLKAEPYYIEDIKVVNQGLGRCILIIGDK